MALKITPRTLRIAAKQVASLSIHRSSQIRHVPVTCCHGNLKYQSISTSSTISRKQILSLSSILYQDGHEMKEFPLVVKRTDLITDEMYSSEEIKQITEQDEYFKRQFEGCEKVTDVMKKLQVPAGKITGYSAAFAVQRICQLKEARDDGEEFDSFVSTAIMNELYDTVKKEVSALSNETVMSLLRCFLKLKNFKPDCGDEILDEIENRIGLGSLEINQLCLISDLVNGHPKIEKEFVKNIWLHIANRYSELNETNVTNVFVNLPKEHKCILPVVIKPLAKCLWKLKEEDVGNIVYALGQHNYSNGAFHKALVIWTSVNIHSITKVTLMKVLAGFLAFKYWDNTFLKLLEKYVKAKKERLDFDLLAFIVEYCRRFKLLSPKIMDVASEIFIKEGSRKPIEQNELFLILRAFGHLNYIPQNDYKFFKLVEELLQEKFDTFDKVLLTELFCSFTYIERIPHNFIHRLKTPAFLNQINRMGDEDKKKVTSWLNTITTACICDNLGTQLPSFGFLPFDRYIFTAGRKKVWKTQIGDIIKKLIGIHGVYWSYMAHSHHLDFVLMVNEQKMVCPKNSRNLLEECDEFSPHAKRSCQFKRIAILLQMSDYYCANMNHLLGEHAVKVKHLKLLNYDVIEIPEYVLHKWAANKSSLKKYIKQELQRYINLPDIPDES